MLTSTQIFLCLLCTKITRLVGQYLVRFNLCIQEATEFSKEKPIYFGFLSEKEIILKLKHKMVFLNNVEITKGNLEFVTMYIWAQGNKTHSFLSVKNWSFSTK